jgi:hypothetical protein
MTASVPKPLESTSDHAEAPSTREGRTPSALSGFPRALVVAIPLSLLLWLALLVAAWWLWRG